MRTGLTFGVDVQTVLRLADGSFAPEQMESLYLAAGDKDITPEMLDVIADASLNPELMDALKISFQQGGSIADVEAEKKSMPRSVKYAGQAGKADAIRSTKLHETAKESREASAQLGSESHAIRPSSARSWSRNSISGFPRFQWPEGSQPDPKAVGRVGNRLNYTY